MNWLKPFQLLTIAALVVGCTAFLFEDYIPIEFDVEGDHIYAYGDIDSGVIERFLDVYNAHPGAKILVLEMVGGSVDDEVNLEFSQIIRDLGLHTFVPFDGLVASGGTDLFLAGTHRTLEPGACVGVHAWATDEFEATDIARDDPVHQDYLKYFQNMGIDPSFYWYTLNAASAKDMHWMTAQEVNRFAMTSSPAKNLGDQDTCQERN